VARDRQRAKQRKARRAQSPGPARSKLDRADLPGELEHASGEVEEFEAALISGADGEPAEQTEDDAVDAAPEALDGEATPEELDDEPTPEELDDEAFAELEDEVDEELEDEDVDEATLQREAARTAPARREAAPGAPTRKGAGRFIGFLRASWAELQRVQWPDRRQVAQATGVVIGFVIVAGLYLGVADWVAKQIVNAII
jgi:preprotein translocase SecE subunit